MSAGRLCFQKYTDPHDAGPGSLRPAPGESENLAGVEGVEPANAGIKIRCLNQLGDTPTQDSCCYQQPTYKLLLNQLTHRFESAFSGTVILPTGQRMRLQIAALSNHPIIRGS